MITYLTAYASATIVLFALDFLWLGVIAKNFYSNQLGDLMLDKPKLGIAAIFYLVYTIGIVLFAVKPAMMNDSWTQALFYGLLFGCLSYGTYDITNMATLKDWPVKMSVIDIAWGSLVSGVAALSAYWTLQKTGLNF